MVAIICVIVAIVALAAVFVASREAGGMSPVPMHAGYHAIAGLLILVALLTPGIWYDATTYLGDLWTAYEAMHKTAQGLRPSLDYFSPIGPAMTWLYALALAVRPVSAGTIVLANVLVAVLAIALSFALLRRRAAPLTVALVLLIAVATALSPRDIDLPLLQSSFLAPYNRWAWALLVPVAMRAALPLEPGDRGGTWLLGPAIAFLFLLKATYAFAAIGVLGVAVVLQPRGWKAGAITAIGFAAALVLVDLATHGQVRAYLADLRATATMPQNGLRIGKLLDSIPHFAVYAIGALLLVVAARRNGEPPLHPLRRHWRALLLALATGGAGLVVLMQNHYYNEPVTLLLMPLIVAEATGLTAAATAGPGALWQRGGEWLALAMLAVLAPVALDAGLILTQPLQLLRKPRLPDLAGTAFADLVPEFTHLPAIDGTCADSTCLDHRRLLSGRAVLRQACLPRPGRAVLAGNFGNPFPSLLGSRSPAASPIWLHENRSFSSAVHVPPERLFADVDCVMVAKNERNAALFATIYAPDLKRWYRPAGQNEDWTVWKRF